MRGEKQTRDRLLQQWADVALGAKKRFVRSLLRQGYRWAVCLEESHCHEDRYGGPCVSGDRQVVAFCRSFEPAYGCLYENLYALGSFPSSNSSGSYRYSTELDGIEHSVDGKIYLVDLSDEEDVRYLFRILE